MTNLWDLLFGQPPTGEHGLKILDSLAHSGSIDRVVVDLEGPLQRLRSMPGRIAQAIAFAFLFHALAAAQDPRRDSLAATWSDTPNVPGHYGSAQAVCDARQAQINFPAELVFFGDPGTTWRGECRFFREATQTWEGLGYAFRGNKCPIGYSAVAWIERRIDVYDKRYIYHGISETEKCRADVPVRRRHESLPQKGAMNSA